MRQMARLAQTVTQTFYFRLFMRLCLRTGEIFIERDGSAVGLRDGYWSSRLLIRERSLDQ